MAKKKTEIEFPRTLYKPAERDDPTATQWGSRSRGGAFHSLLVENKKERKAGLQMGYFDNFARGRSFDYEETGPELEEMPIVRPDLDPIEEEGASATETETTTTEPEQETESEPKEKSENEETDPEPEENEVVDTTPEPEDEGF